MKKFVAATATLVAAGSLMACTAPESHSVPPSMSSLTSTVKDTAQQLTSAAPGATNTPAAPAADSLNAQLQQIVNGVSGTAAIAVTTASGTSVADNLGQQPAWSTSKVPVAMAALEKGTANDGDVTMAITQSDNAAAQRLWDSLGGGQAAASATEAQITKLGASAKVPASAPRAGFTAFGQTQMDVKQQATLAAGLACDSSAPAQTVKNNMGNVIASQAFGLGTIGGAQFKGGWGPDDNGTYLVRQLGIVDTGNGKVGVAIAVKPSNGSFEAGQQALSQMAGQLSSVLNGQKGKC